MFPPPGSPGIGAVPVQRLEVGPCDELAPVHPGLDGAESPQDAHLLHGAHHRADLQPLQLGVDGVQPAHQVLQEELEHLRQADQLHAVHRERRHLGAVNFHHPAVGLRGSASAARPVHADRDSNAAAEEGSGQAGDGEVRGAGGVGGAVGRLGGELGVGGRRGGPRERDVRGARHDGAQNREQALLLPFSSFLTWSFPVFLLLLPLARANTFPPFLSLHLSLFFPQLRVQPIRSRQPHGQPSHWWTGVAHCD